MLAVRGFDARRVRRLLTRTMVPALPVLLTACSAGGSSPASATPPAGPTAVAVDAAQPSPPPSPTPTEPATAAVVPVAALTSPTDGDAVRGCAVFRGTAALPETKTLALGRRNLDSTDPTRSFQAVQDWGEPRQLDTWQGYQWFGTGDSSVGRRYRVEVLIIDRSFVDANVARGQGESWESRTNPAGAVVVARVTLERVAGDGPAECS
jgi:hypothetical protein